MKTEKNIPESLLIAYLYGEVSEAEKEQVEQYLAGNPEAESELLALREVRKKLSAIPDKEVIIPVLAGALPQHKADARIIRTLLAVAASVAIILVSGWLTGTRISWSENELRISFGKTQEPAAASLLTADQVRVMIEQALRENTEKASETNLTEQQVRNWINASVAAGKHTPPGRISNEQLEQFTAALYAENARLMREFINLSAREQQQTIEELLIDFTRYINQQRQNDLQSLYARLNALEQNTELYKQETDQLLTGIMSSVAAPVREVRN
jgi:predicted transcriptional regulator